MEQHEEQKRKARQPLFEGLDSDRDLLDSEAKKTITDPNEAPKRMAHKDDARGPFEKLVDKLTGEDHSK